MTTHDWQPDGETGEVDPRSPSLEDSTVELHAVTPPTADDEAPPSTEPTVSEDDSTEIGINVVPAPETLPEDATMELTGSVLVTRLDEVRLRIHHLSKAIEHHPEAPVNYVIRGELYIRLGLVDKAVDDFKTALILAESRTTNWDFVNRSYIDRAQQGLRRCGYD